jgi:hypothetical protein
VVDVMLAGGVFSSKKEGYGAVVLGSLVGSGNELYEEQRR